MKEIIKKDIMAIVPTYLHNTGNCTMIYTREGNVEVEKSIKTVIKNISKFYHLDLKASNNTYGNMLCNKKNPPIAFTPKDIFVLVKTRKPLAQHDGAYGYVRVGTIEKIQYKKGMDIHPKIIFKNGQSIEALCNLNTLKKNLSYGDMIDRLLNLNADNLVKESHSMYLEEEKPATKKDIALLYMEIKKLKQ